MKPIYPQERLMSNGKYLTQALFYEFRHQVAIHAEPIYTLREKDFKTFVSVYRVYMESDSEYEAAQRLFGSWKHWQRLCECAWFKSHVEDWREEVKIKEAAIGKTTLIEQALKGSVPAAKELVFQVTKKRSLGRPSTKEKTNKDKVLEKVDAKVVSMLTRMGHNV